MIFFKVILLNVLKDESDVEELPSKINIVGKITYI